MRLAVLGISQLVTLRGPAGPRTGPAMRELGVFEDGALIVSHGRIEAVGTRGEIEPLIGDAETIDAGGRVVLPGFVDAHTHPVFGGSRANEFEMRASGSTYQEIAASGGGIRSTMSATRAASEDELFAVGKRYGEWFLKGGTTTIEAKSGYGLSLEQELKLLRVIQRLDNETPLRYVPTLLGAHALPPEFSDDREGYERLVIEQMIPEAAAEGLARYCDIFCEKNYFDLESTERVLTAAKRHGLGLRVHADQLNLTGAARLAARLGAKTADHLEQSQSACIEAMRDAGVQPVLLPASVYALGLTKYPAAREMIDRGLAVVLATDFNPGSSPTPSMPFVMSLACTQMRMTPAEALTATTINAAFSLDLAHEVGSLEPGKIADFAIFDCEDWREIPYWIGVGLAHRVFAQGQELAFGA